MIKTVSVDQRACDFCGGDAYEWTRCLGCGKDLCSMGAMKQGKNRHVVEYAHGVHASGSGDGHYCVPCDIRLSESKDDPLHQAYVAVRALRDENQRLYMEQKRKQETAEANVTRLRSERGLR